MAHLDLRATGNKNIQTTFRYEVVFPNSPRLGLNDQITVYCVSCDLPKVMRQHLVWSMPGGMENKQAGKGKVQPIKMTFVTPSNSDTSTDVIQMITLWGNSAYNINTGKNASKAVYAVDGVWIHLKDESMNNRHSFQLLKAQMTDSDYSTVQSEQGELLKVTASMEFDNFKVYRDNVEISLGILDTL